MKRKYIKVSLIVFFLAASCIVSSIYVIRDFLDPIFDPSDQAYKSMWSSQLTNDTIARGNTIIHELQAYRDNRGLYPSTLDELRSSNFTTIPVPLAGQNTWYYSVSKDRWSFALGFGYEKDGHIYPARFYNSNEEKWQADY